MLVAPKLAVLASQDALRMAFDIVDEKSLGYITRSQVRVRERYGVIMEPLNTVLCAISAYDVQSAPVTQ